MRRSTWFLGLLWLVAEMALAFPLALRDGRGQTVRLPARPNRVISLTVATDEILWDLYGDAERKRLLGLSFLAWEPKYSNIATQVADSGKMRSGDDVEALIKGKPDLVIAASFTRAEIVAQLERAGIPVYVFTKFLSFDDIRSNILVLGDLSGFPKEAEKLAQTFTQRIQAVRDKPIGKRPSLLNFDRDGVIFGSDCLFDEIVTAAGADNYGRTLGIKGWQPLTAERLVTARPDFVLINTENGEKEARREATRATGWKSLTAVKNGRFIVLEGRLLNAASHYTAEAVEILHGKLFPTSH